MAEKPEDQFSRDEKIAKAKELYSVGCRNYYVKAYSNAADDLSEACKLYSDIYGVVGDELGDVYLLYAKALIAIGQEENKLIEVPEEDEDEEDDEEEAEPVVEEIAKEAETNGAQNGEAETNGHDEEPQAGPSGANDNESSNDTPEDNETEDADDGGDLEAAWEVLLNAVEIFERQGDAGLNKLMDCCIEMGGISLENGNFDVAIKDFTRALDVFMDLDETDQNQRIAAEIHYKIGLCKSMIKEYDESVKSFQTAADLLDEVIAKEKSREQQTEEVLASIKDLQETQQEIINKITEIGETKAEEVEQVKKEMAKMFGPIIAQNGSADGAGTSSSSAPAQASSAKSPEAEKSKPTDISHLIKRKKPDSESNVEESPAKKKAIETSPGEKVAVAVNLSMADKVPEESSETVPVIPE